MIALHNRWMETLDYVHHQATLNCHSAQVEADGSVRFVIARRDPGLPNWLDTAGHERGTVGVRWVGPNVVDILPSDPGCKDRLAVIPTPQAAHTSDESIAGWRAS